MAEESFTRWLELPQGVPVRFGDLPRMIARKLHQGEWAQAGAEVGLETELKALVDSGVLTVCDPLTLGPQTFPVGRTLRASVLLPEDLRSLLAARGIGLRLIPDGAAAESAPVELAGLQLPEELREGLPPSAAQGTQPMQRWTFQEQEILRVLRELRFDPRALPKPAPGKPGPKAAARTTLGTLGVWSGERVFDKAWERLRVSGGIADKG